MKVIGVTLFVNHLPWSAGVRQRIKDMLQMDHRYVAFTATEVDGQLKAAAWEKVPESWGDSTKFIAYTPLDVGRPMPTSKTGIAVLLVEQGLSRHQAASKAGVDYASVQKAVKRRERRGVCQCCGQLLPKNSTVNPIGKEFALPRQST